MKRQPTEREKTSVNHVSDKELLFRIYKEVLNLNNKKPQRTQFKMDKGLE